jgi:hypothetical protein
MALPARIKSEPMGREKRIRCPSHLKWVRQHMCCVPGCDGRPVEAAHVRSGADGGTGMKPGDDWAISLCTSHHREQHWTGEARFERRHGIDMKALAREFAARSPHKAKLIRRQ